MSPLLEQQAADTARYTIHSFLCMKLAVREREGGPLAPSLAPCTTTAQLVYIYIGASVFQCSPLPGLVVPSSVRTRLSMLRLRTLRYFLSSEKYLFYCLCRRLRPSNLLPSRCSLFVHDGNISISTRAPATRTSITHRGPVFYCAAMTLSSSEVHSLGCQAAAASLQSQVFSVAASRSARG